MAPRIVRKLKCRNSLFADCVDYGASVTFPTAVTKYLTRSNAREEELILVYSLRRDIVH